MTQVQKSSQFLSKGIRGGHLVASGKVGWAQQPLDLSGGHGNSLFWNTLGCTLGDSWEELEDRLRGSFPTVRGMLSQIRQKQRSVTLHFFAC